MRKKLDVQDILQSSVYFVKDCFDRDDIEASQKFEIAARFALKYMPEKVEMTAVTVSLSNEFAAKLLQYLPQFNQSNDKNLKFIEQKIDDSSSDTA